MDELTQWLLATPPWVRYRTLVDLQGQPESAPEVRTTRQAMLEHPAVQGLVAQVSSWPGRVLTSHKTAGHPLHQLTFLADLGATVSDPGMDRVVECIFEHQERGGPFQVLVNIPPHFGGSGKDQLAWALCDAPLVLYALAKMGLAEDRRFQEALELLISLRRENGWPCAVSAEMGKFRGPGRKDDPCPYATLLMLKTLAVLPGWRDSQASVLGAKALLNLWAERSGRHPYLFYMGTDFCKLKAPFVWYDILHVADVLTQFPWLRSDPLLAAIIEIIGSKADPEFRFVPESIWTSWKEWDFGQKKTASPWLTLLANRILLRFYQSESRLPWTNPGNSAHLT